MLNNLAKIKRILTHRNGVKVTRSQQSGRTVLMKNTCFILRQSLHQVFGLLPPYNEQLTRLSICFHGDSLPWHSTGQPASLGSGQVCINLSSHGDGGWWGRCRREVTTDKVIVSVRRGGNLLLCCDAQRGTLHRQSSRWALPQNNVCFTWELQLSLSHIFVRSVYNFYRVRVQI